MNWFKNLFVKIGNGIKWCFTPAGQLYINKTTAQVEMIVATFLPLIETLAATNKTASAALATAESFGAKIVPSPNATVGEILHTTAAFLITLEFPKVPSSVVNLAIETALQFVKAKAA